MLKFKISGLLVLFATILFFGYEPTEPDPGQKINAVLGDISLIQKYGEVPENLNEKERIKTHLAYVEKLLRARNTLHLSEELQAKRNVLLDGLNAYLLAGNFPKNYDFPEERRPCFIDKDGNICAVGFLIAQTAGRGLAEKINSQHQYDRIYDMKTPELLAWVKNSGLTLEECAMIQPQYGPPPSYSYNYIPTGYAVPSAVLGGANLSFNAINLIQIAQGSDSKLVPVLGLASGISSVILGVANLENESERVFDMYPRTNEAKKALSMLNIGLGTSTVVLSTWNLLHGNAPAKEKKISWNVYGFPTENQEMGVGFSVRKQF